MRDDHPFHRNRKVAANKKQLTQAVAQASLTGLRQVWTPSSVADGLTPEKLAGILKAAEIGNHHEQLELAEAMEERDLHLGSVLATRKLAIQGLEVTVEPCDEETRNVEICDAVYEDVVRKPEFDELIDDLTDALFKGYSAVVIDWKYGERWIPQGYRWCDPRWFVWDQATGRELRLIDEANPTEGVPLAERRWITHIPRIKSGLPARSGLARLVSIAYMCKTWTIKDWMAFADTYGLPLRVGKYGAGATAEDKQTLISAIANIASDAGAVIPESMMIEFIDAAKGTTGGDVMFKSLAEYLDAQVSKRILGHTGSSDATPGRLGGEDQASEVRLDILKADAKQLAATLNRDLVRSYVDVNFGPQQHYPQINIQVPEPEDTKLLVEALDKLIPHGLQVEQHVVREKLGLPDPELDENEQPKNVLLRAPAATAPETEPALQRELLHRSEQTTDLDEVLDRVTQAADQHVENWLQHVLDEMDTAIAAGEDLAVFAERMLSLYGELDPRELAAVIGKALVIANVGGRAEVDDGQ